MDRRKRIHSNFQPYKGEMLQLDVKTQEFFELKNNDQQLSLVGERNKKKYSLGDDIYIKIKKVDFKKRQAYFALSQKEASSGFEPL